MYVAIGPFDAELIGFQASSTVEANYKREGDEHMKSIAVPSYAAFFSIERPAQAIAFPCLNQGVGHLLTRVTFVTKLASATRRLRSRASLGVADA